MTALLADPIVDTALVIDPPVDFLIDIDVPIDPMDLDALPPHDIDQCGPCHGSGEVYAGYTEIETGAPVTVRCDDCHGSGRP